ncbi:AMP-binding protein [Mangrovitalea sediminis]|uniref:AMP-binding protein n=1 Tax=Mangrovitalea sediminis TaxID=1982043 RepID=UPI000BE5176B|nr:AMP-binding protein [Mangrovitalea sediminis]
MQLVDIVKGKSPIEMLYHWEKETPNSIYLRQPIDGTWYEYTWAQVADKVRRLTSALYDLGFERGDRIAILSKNCAEWLITDLALQLGGFVSVPLYFDQSEETFTYILEHSEARAIFVGKLDQAVWHRLRNSIPEGVVKIGFSYYGSDGDCQREQDVEYLIPDLIAKAPPFEGTPVPADDDIWTIVYTSGTTGYPKGAVHCYRAPRHVAVRALSIFDLNPRDRALSFLPLAHVAERLLVANNSLYSGMQVSFSQSLKTFQNDLCSVQPTIFFSVPRLWKKFQSGILEKVPQKKLDRMLKIPLLRGMVAKKLRVALGLSQARIIVSGAAAISPSLLDWYAKLGIEIVEGYGMTENLAYGFIGRPGANKSGTVGQAMPDNGFKLSEEGEILFKSPTLMAGYYKDEEKTKEAMTGDGYYRTGDLGVLDGQGFLRISGRVKEIFKTEKGEYVAPAPIESKLAAYKGFEQICLGGVGLVQPVAVVTLTEQIRNQPRDVLEQEIRDFVRELNGNLLNHEKISGIVVANQDWSPDTGLVTPTLKIKRSRLEARYAPYMAQLAPPERVVVWEEG